jgi:hypothetical protein
LARTKKRLWEIDPKKPITFRADLAPEKLDKNGNIPVEVQVAVRNSIRHAVIATLESHGLLDRASPVDFEAESPVKHVGGGSAPEAPDEEIDTISSPH